MDCLNFKKEKNRFVFDSLDYQKFKEKGDKIMHWLPAEDLINTEVVMDDGTVKKGLGEKAITELDVGTIVQLERFAFCRLDKKDKDKVTFWFAHR